ncbi:MAG: TetR/AcrR family transcriptional regulator [Peptococcaceae bacterium]|nr:TetR/AcrR family transcriptional regulator [Peptococcaceae bacterium]
MTTQDKKEIIAGAALSCFKQGGYGGTSMDDIVKRSGISKGGIYWHFKSKEEIFLYLLEKETINEKAAFNTLSQKDGTALDRLREYMNWQVQNTVNSSIHILLPEFLTRVKQADTMDRLKDIMTGKHTGFQTIREILNQGVSSGELPDLDCRVMAELYWSLCEGIVSRYYIFHQDSELLKKTFVAAEDIFINGIINGTNK